MKNEIESQSFYSKYLKKHTDDNNEYSFFLGYYCHLVTDIEWSRMFKKKIDADPVYERLETDKKFI
ncbi:hypothetical protein, partial [Anaerosolibacter sp.]|uniref:hypothetical protein n=1 Tax=Anaerosolibacter sp. TaxID=1872527 RepID=UPI0039EEE8BA